MYVSAKLDSQEEIVKPVRLFPAYGSDPKPIQRTVSIVDWWTVSLY